MLKVVTFGVGFFWCVEVCWRKIEVKKSSNFELFFINDYLNVQVCYTFLFAQELIFLLSDLDSF